ncbi:MAG: asparagine synthase (glutamine-hydrolyzing), partial [Gammaproteobacteria bacterium]|nr:asparagine synthase (glutamine-hydrolyzing) [Gammaproteobacteria bacterium]
ICPLYYSQVGQTVYFSSEIKCLLTVPEIAADVNLASFSEFIHLWTPLTPNTLFKDIFEVSPGCYLEIEKSGIKSTRYWDFEYHPGDLDASLSETVCLLESLLEDAVKIRLRSDVAVGAYLSGGLDSTIILSYLRKLGVDLSTFSLTFADKQLDEASFQDDVTSYFSTRHHSVHADNYSIAENFIECIRHTESPLFRTSPVPMMLLSRKVREEGYKVVLTGEGSDEIFGGYDIFKEAKIREFWARYPNSTCRPMLLKKLYPYLDFTEIKSTDYLKQVFGHNLAQTDDLLYAYHTRARSTSAVKGFLTSDINEQINQDMETRARETFPIFPGQYSVFNTTQYIESKTIMPGFILSSQGDRMLMANSVEGRFPFLDHRVIELAARLKTSHKMHGLNEKYILKKMVKGKIPESVLNRPKQPYRAPDINALMCSKNSHLLDYLSEHAIKKNGFFKHQKVGLLIKKVLSGKAQSVKDNMLFTNILSTQIWLEEFIH